MKRLFFRTLLPCFAVLALLGQGCLQTNIIPQPMPAERPVAPPSDDVRTPSSDEPARASTYEPFSEARFEADLEEGRPIYLYYIASWCPTCREQQPRNESVVPNHPGGISGYYIHILDNETGALEERYAERYNVNYQHTAIYFHDGQELFRKIGTQSNAQMNADLDRISE